MGQGQEVHARRLLQQCQTQVHQIQLSYIVIPAILGWMVASTKWALGS